MLPVRLFLLAVALLPSWLVGQAPDSAPADTAFYAVAYVETMAEAARAARSALERYRDASRQQDGLLREEIFERVGRPGHFAVIETWRVELAG